jgi:Transglutaminase-like superfamily
MTDPLRSAPLRAWRRTGVLACVLIVVAAVAARGMARRHRNGILASAPPGPNALASGPANSSGQTPSGEADFASTLNAIAQNGAALHPSTIDPAAKASELGPDVAAAFAFVRDHVRDEVYAGVLRGARGTLLAGAGNAADKSLLLADLLRAHGLSVRFVRGRLTADRAGALVDQMFTSAGKPGRVSLPDARAGEPAALARLRNLMARWDANTRDVQSVLRRDGVALGTNPPVPRSTLVAEASDHVWIEVQQNGNWTPLDPSFRDAAPGQAFANPDVRLDSLPADLDHTITLRVVVDQRTGTTIASHDVLRYQGVAAALSDVPVVLNTRLESSGGAWKATPFIQVGEKVFRGRSFTASGVSPAASPGGAVASGLSAVAQAFGSGPPPAAAADLTAVWIVVDTHAPGGRTETVRRAMLDRIGPAARLEHRESSAALARVALLNDQPVALGGLYACAFSTGGVPAGFAATQLAAALPALRAAAPAVAALTAGRPLADQEAARVADTLAPVVPAVLHAAALSFDRASQAALELARSAASADVLFYDAEPRLVITSVEPALAPDGRTLHLRIGVDLRRNVMRAVSGTATGSQVVWASVLRGVLDGVLEQELFGDLRPRAAGPVGGASTAAVFDQAHAAGARVTTVTTRDALARLTLPAAARAVMQAALDAGGTALVAPDRAVRMGGADRVGWWQIDLATGETLGVLDTGLHQEFEEYEETTLVSEPWTGPAPKPSFYTFQASSRVTIVATSEEAGLQALAEELAREVARVTRFLVP